MNNEIDLSVEKRVLQIEKIINENIIGYEVEYFSYPTVLESRKEELLPLHITLWKAEKPVLIIGVIEYETIKGAVFTQYQKTEAVCREFGISYIVIRPNQNESEIFEAVKVGLYYSCQNCLNWCNIDETQNSLSNGYCKITKKNKIVLSTCRFFCADKLGLAQNMKSNAEVYDADWVEIEEAIDAEWIEVDAIENIEAIDIVLQMKENL